LKQKIIIIEKKLVVIMTVIPTNEIITGHIACRCLVHGLVAAWHRPMALGGNDPKNFTTH
jgi:hypothetical protein